MKNAEAAFENWSPLSPRSLLIPITAAYWIDVNRNVTSETCGDTYIDHHLIDELHHIAEEHDWYNPPVDLPPQCLEVNRLVAIIVVFREEKVCLVKIFLICLETGSVW